LVYSDQILRLDLKSGVLCGFAISFSIKIKLKDGGMASRD